MIKAQLVIKVNKATKDYPERPGNRVRQAHQENRALSAQWAHKALQDHRVSVGCRVPKASGASKENGVSVTLRNKQA